MPRTSSRVARIAWRTTCSRAGLTPAKLQRLGIARSMTYHLAAGRSSPGATTLALLPTRVVLAWLREMRRMMAARAR